ncbi:GerAB/ArcD/ProY family transporter [Metabacillus rhizolycopersici]|uniref:Spore germination protein n=1 Tax=Metabacillus rhizolycopersici TaxID=2875709 RepID=A0ABS7UUQ4_9BACI|nr:GerAB/ArcD/ProY family transporter [Metabacillus rhizolycopersici]MBZ5752048.1 spore germination protein [Metabacillus rhizolycopersici]
MIQNKIQPIQFFVLMVLFEVGSAVVVGLGLEAKQDAWIAILLGMIGGLVLFSLYVYLYLQFPTLSLTNFLEKIVGKLIGRTLAIVYICLFLYITARLLRTFSDLLLTTVLYGTPIVAVAILIMLVVSYSCYLGFEVIARTAEIFFPWVMIFSFLFILFVFISGLPKLENLQPVLEAGWKPIFQTVYPTILSFPFGETLVFAIFFPYLNKQKEGIVAGFIAIIISGVIITTATTIMISVLGPFKALITPFPLLETIEKINVGEVFNRLDPIALILLIIGGYFKITIFFCGAVEGFSSLINKPNLKKFTIPLMAAVVITMSILMASNYVEHNKNIKPIANLLHAPLFIAIPLLLVVIVIIKKKIKQKNKK